LTLPIRVLAKGFPRQQNAGGMIGSTLFSNGTPSSANFSINIPQTLQNNSAIFKFQLFSSNYAQLTQAIQSLIQEPYGCFEQASSTVFPMIMAMKYLKALPEEKQASSDVQSMMVDMQGKLKKGYDKLVSFQT
jgi:alpha-2-macroglobulin-like protein